MDIVWSPFLPIFRHLGFLQLLFFVSNMAKTILVRVLGCKKQRQILVKKTENEFIGRLE